MVTTQSNNFLSELDGYVIRLLSVLRSSVEKTTTVVDSLQLKKNFKRLSSTALEWIFY